MLHPELDGNSFYFEGTKLHFACARLYATTTEVRTLAEHYLALGRTVAAPLLPGHGTHPDELNQTRWQDWYEAVRQTYLDLRARNKKIWLAGESMGALLCLKLAMDFSEIEGLLLFAPGLKVRNLKGALLLQFFKDHLKKTPGDRSMPWKGYNVYPLKGAVHLLKLQKLVKKDLYKITQPTMVMVAKLIKRSNWKQVKRSLFHFFKTETIGYSTFAPCYVIRTEAIIFSVAEILLTS